MSKYFAFANWDLSSRYDDTYLVEKSTQLRDLYLGWARSMQENAPIFSGPNLREILISASQSGRTLCFVQATGHLLYKTQILDLVEQSHRQEGWALMGHVLQNDTSYFELHPQGLVVDLKKYAAMGFPELGEAGLMNQEIVSVERSAENIHDGYTPLWIKKASGGTETIKKTGPGWNLIHAALSRDEKIVNFDQQMRGGKTYLYPELNDLSLTRAWQELSQLFRDGQYLSNQTESFRLGSIANPLQREWYQKLKGWVNGTKAGIYLFNTESIAYSHLPSLKKPIGILAAAAAGFMPYSILAKNSFTEKTKVLLFDISEAALGFHQELLARWDGRDFPAYLRSTQGSVAEKSYLPPYVNSYGAHSYEDAWQKTLADLGGAEKFAAAWDKIKKCEFEFLRCDLLSEGEKVTKNMCALATSEDTAVIWTSNIFFSEAAHSFLDRAKLTASYDTFLTKYQDGFTDAHLIGFDQDNLWKKGTAASFARKIGHA